MLTQADRNRIAINVWTARIIPIVLGGIVAYASYVLVVLCSVNYLLVKHNNKGAAISILVTYFVLFILMTVCFLRLVYVTITEPPYVPLGVAAQRDRHNHNESGTTRSKVHGIAMGEYYTGDKSGGPSPEVSDPHNDPDSPGLELFYTKDVFVCSMDGRPIWCSECSNWKPDRTHHDSSSGRCIRRMDHFCPWVGGPVGENNIKFFIQFNSYTTLYCFHLLVVMAYYIHKQLITQGENVDRQFIAILALATFFGLFTASLAGTSLNLAALNLTQVERLGGKTKVYILAIFKANHDKPCSTASLGEITYPLDSGFRPMSHAPFDLSGSRQYGTTQSPHDVDNAQGTEASIVQAAYPPANSSKYVRTGEITQISRQPLVPQADGSQDADTSATAPAPVFSSVQQRRSGTAAAPEAEKPSTEIPGLVGDAPLANAETNPTATLSTGNAKRRNNSIRDSRATRKFEILKMLQPGDNPWDLGSARLNIETVMGTSIIDWLLPIRRSPCCDHEAYESQFQVGPKVALLRASMQPAQTMQDPSLHEPNGLPMSNLNNNAV